MVKTQVKKLDIETFGQAYERIKAKRAIREKASWAFDRLVTVGFTAASAASRSAEWLVKKVAGNQPIAFSVSSLLRLPLLSLDLNATHRKNITYQTRVKPSTCAHHPSLWRQWAQGWRRSWRRRRRRWRMRSG